MATKFKRGNVWWVDGRIDGKRVQESLCTTDEDEADLALANFIQRAHALKTGSKQKEVSWAQFRQEYTQHCIQSKAPRAWARDQTAINAFEKSRPNIKRINEITLKFLKDLSDEWKRSRPFYARNRDLRALKTAMRWAEENYAITKQDWTKVPLEPEPKVARFVWYNDKERLQLESVCQGPWLTGLYLGTRAGWRPGEIYHMRWDWIDFATQKLRVDEIECPCKQCHEYRHGLWKPKTAKSYSPIPMEGRLSQYLWDLRKTAKNDWVWTREDGTRTDEESMSAYYGKLIHKAGLKGTTYSFRHTFASQLISNGWDIKVVKDLMRHENIEMTEKYAHVAPSTYQAALNGFDKGLHEQRRPALSEGLDGDKAPMHKIEYQA